MSANSANPVATSRCARSAGFSLIEVLVALVVLSVGLLGLAALQQNAVQIQPRRVLALAGDRPRL